MTPSILTAKSGDAVLCDECPIGTIVIVDHYYFFEIISIDPRTRLRQLRCCGELTNTTHRYRVDDQLTQPQPRWPVIMVGTMLAARYLLALDRGEIKG